MADHVLLAVEEALSLYFIHPGRSEVSLMLSYSEKDGTLQIRFDEHRPPCHFLEEAEAEDDLALTLLKGIVHDINWKPTPEGNQITMTLNETVK